MTEPSAYVHKTAVLLQFAVFGGPESEKPNGIRVDAAMNEMPRNMCAANALEAAAR